MKTKTIDLAAASFPLTFRVFQDGDVFRESNLDLIAEDFADALGWLKTAVDDRASLSDNNSWTGTQTFATTVGDITVTDDGGGDFICQAPFQANTANFGGTVEFDDRVFCQGGVAFKVEALADASSAITNTTFHARVPAAIAAARTYTLPSTVGLEDGASINVEKVDTAAQLVTIQDPTGPTTIATITSGSAGWVECIKRGSNWRVGRWGGAVTIVSAVP